MTRFVDLYCLACGAELAEPLRRGASLRCHDCREAGEPISLELALQARKSLSRAETIRWAQLPDEETAA
jgi:hypothetical protein